MILRGLIMLTLAALGAAVSACDGLRIENGWIRLPPPNVEHVAAYADLHNDGAAPVHISAVTSNDFDGAMLHDVSYVEGRARMRHLGLLTIEPGAHRAIAPGGTHIMLSRGDRALEENMLFELEFVCEGGHRASGWFSVSRTPQR